ncbi:cobalamin biosynthesis protein CobG [Sulfitobacter sp. 1151]|uniref:Cobalamin biosynthesis protein CobG n=2 Tax=Parasulfitobacter algicola TaxID=2614809 RepID=A0ABX2J1K7_9RHOB|nr:cobalamin biosynthesis protein CobG [Sulfitobacter algicola]NSX56828.1 cobalamin biosynthesis protein CobG [Sulfitobacter algicola]
MMSGDGLIVRVRPKLGRVERGQLRGLCQLSKQYGNGLFDLTNRANLQLRGIKMADYDAVLQQLAALNLLDASPDLERRRNVLIQPFWQTGDVTHRLATKLTDRLAYLPDLPAKFGFAVDTGPDRLLTGASADIRIERMGGGLIVRADGAETGQAVYEEEVIDAVITLASWFTDHAGPDVRRMRTLLDAAPVAAQNDPLHPQNTPHGQLVGLPFGQIEASDMEPLLDQITAVRLTPWRLMLLEGIADLTSDALITTSDHPLRHIDACPGAPFCDSAQVETRALARSLASHITGTLHVSGCAKGCARGHPADITLVGRDGRFDIVRQGTAKDRPERTGILPANVHENLD